MSGKHHDPVIRKIGNLIITWNVIIVLAGVLIILFALWAKLGCGDG